MYIQKWCPGITAVSHPPKGGCLGQCAGTISYVNICVKRFLGFLTPVSLATTWASNDIWPVIVCLQKVGASVTFKLELDLKTCVIEMMGIVFDFLMSDFIFLFSYFNLTDGH